MLTILTDRIVQDAADVARGLHVAFMQVLKLPNVQGRRAATLAAELKVGRMTCQRITKLGKQHANAPSPGPTLLVDLPGINGLRQFLEALERAGTSRDLLADAFAAVDAFDVFLRKVELSQTNFASALSLYYKTADPDQLLDLREKLFDAASAVTGQSADATISMMSIRPSRQENFTVEQIAVRGYSQMRASGSAMPIRLPINMAYADYRNVAGDEAARQPQKLIEAFCTRPLPSIDSRAIKAQHLAHLVNPEHIPSGEPFDCFATQFNQWNVAEPVRHKAIWLYIDYPTRHCTFDLYLHRTIAEQHDLSADCHLWGTSLLAPPEDLWMTRFADQIQFTALGPGTAGAASDAYSQHKALTECMFEHHDWNSADFVGFRCEMQLPVWRSGLCHVMLMR